VVQVRDRRSRQKKPAQGSDTAVTTAPMNREKILATALTLFVERGFSGTPTALISKEAGVSTGTLFFYFKTKEELIDTLYTCIKQEAAEALSPGSRKDKTIAGKIRHYMANAVAWGLQNPKKITFMEQFANSPFVSKGAHEEGTSHFLFMEDLVHDGIREGSIRPIDVNLLFYIMGSSIGAIIELASKEQDPGRRQKVVDDGLDLIMGGMRA